MNKLIVFDLEIIRAIPTSYEPVVPGIEYCAGWSDYEHMGISVAGAYDALEDRYRVFCADNFDEFRQLVDQADIVCGFNSIGFDNRLIAACLGWEVPAVKHYDLLAEIWAASGLKRSFGGKSHTGFSLDAVAKANGHAGKTGNGALAPVLWQQGKVGQVISYCLDDVRLEWKLIEEVIRTGHLVCPKTSNFLSVNRPGVETSAVPA